jgi:glycosyltransferase involved in cell wall biosynthesis
LTNKKPPGPHCKILVNCSNLHVGGGVAVATSFINCLSYMEHGSLEISLLLSSHVNKNLISLKTDTSAFSEVVVKDFYGLSALWKGVDNCFNQYDLVFTIFGPTYFIFKNTRHIVGFAQPLIIYPFNPVSRGLTLYKRVKQRIKYKIQELFFSRSDEIIVELEHVQNELEKKALFKSKNIHVVYNAVDSIFNEPARWAPAKIRDTGKRIKLGLISRNYPHKNLSCLPDLKKLLNCKYGIACEFFVTFTDLEWAECSESFKNNINNVGVLSLAQCPSFYSQMDGVVFPSLLECFSAVPIEAMMMRTPLFASELPFIKDCCLSHANYFDPLSVDSMALSIKNYYSSSKDVRIENLNIAYQFVLGYPAAKERAASYIEIINKSVGI